MNSLVFPVWLSIIFYLGMFAGAAVLVYWSQKKRKTYLAWIAVAVLIIMIGFRGVETGTDSLTYEHFMNDIARQDLSMAWARMRTLGMEPFIVLFALLGRVVAAPVQLLIFLPHAVVMVVFFYLASRKLSAKYGWLIFTMLMFVVFLFMMNGTRQAAAMAVLLYAFTFLLEIARYRFVAFGTLSIFAIGLHFSAVIAVVAMAVAYGISKMTNGGRLAKIKLPYVMSVLIAITVILSNFFLFSGTIIGVLPYKFNESLARYGVGLYPNYNFVLFFGLFSLLAVIWEKKNKPKKIDIYLAMMFMALVFSAPAFFSSYLGRITDYFMPFALAIFIMAITPKLNMNKRLVKCIIALAIIYCIVKYFIMGGSEILPYSFFIGGV